MHVILQIIFWGSALGLTHTYVIYPLLLRWLAYGKTLAGPRFAADDAQLPVVSVLMSLHNEEQVIASKIASLLALDYPAEKLFFYIGSDGSTDQTNAICRQHAAAPEHFVAMPLPEHGLAASAVAIAGPSLFFFPFEQRRGKPPVINDLASAALAQHPAGPDHVLLLTDASVMLEPDTLYRLVRHFKHPRMGVVDANMRTAGLRPTGISHSEEQYISREVLLKHREGLVWGKMLGPFGGCYALRSDLFENIPRNSLVDDFYLAFRALERGYIAINDLEAICYENATHRVADEYRRKKRIAAGSFQNLKRFATWVLPPRTRLGFAFFSHKVLRWFGGFFIFFLLTSAGLLGLLGNYFYQTLFWLMVTSVVVVQSLNYDLSRRNIEPVGPMTWVRNIAYFLAMNLALVDGFFKWFRGGIRDNIWQRTARE